MATINATTRQTVWWTYFAIISTLFGISFVNYVMGGFFATFASTIVTWLIVSFDVICLAGLFAYIRPTAVFLRRLLACSGARALCSGFAPRSVIFVQSVSMGADDGTFCGIIRTSVPAVLDPTALCAMAICVQVTSPLVRVPGEGRVMLTS
jgi:hypothetical protein